MGKEEEEDPTDIKARAEVLNDPLTIQTVQMRISGIGSPVGRRHETNKPKVGRIGTLG